MRSMTGYGQASVDTGGRRLAVEVRSVNHRFLDVKVSLPRDSQMWEAELRQAVTGAAARGKVDVSVIRVGSGDRDFTVDVNESLARASLAGWKRLQQKLKLPGEIDLSFLLTRSEFVRIVEERPDPGQDLPRVRRLLRTAVTAWNRSREREGRALARDMRARLAALRRLEVALRRRTEVLVPVLAQRLRERLAGLLESQQISEERLVQEAAMLAERADVNEELVRLGSHLERLADLLRQSDPAGKQIDFLMQEIHREVNTIASKSADLEVTQLTLAARSEVEKLREQTQNVE